MVINKTQFISPNQGSRHGTEIDTIIIHHTGGSFPGCASWLTNPEAKASAHFIINKQGDVYQLVDPLRAAWHAGRSAFDYNKDGSISDKERSLNRRSIGIELESMGDAYSQMQLHTLRKLVLVLVLQYDIPTSNILGHKEIAPGRKWDPGNFDMSKFRAIMDDTLNTAHISVPLIYGEQLHGQATEGDDYYAQTIET